jgi:hypothetical protein
MNALLTAIVTWLSVNFGLPAVYDHPAIELLPATQIAVLPDSWTGKTPSDLSILVHEMVHHLQNIAGLQFECSASREKAAYAAQEAWLALFGQSLLSEFELNQMALKLTTQCMPF